MSIIQFIADGPWGMVAAGVWGALWGSFVNVVIVRLPAGESLVSPRSHCRNCREALQWYDNIPLLSYLFLLGRCRRCGARFSARYWLVELLLCGLSVLLFHLFVVEGVQTLGPRLAQFVITSLFCGFLLAVAFIDLATMKIPNALTYPAIPIAILLSLFMVHPRWWNGFIGGVVGYVAIRFISDGWRVMTGRLGMGYGDAKLLAVIGGLLGWQALLPTLLFASLQGAALGIPVLMFYRRGKKDDEPLRWAGIPFGPFLSLAAIEVLVFRDILSQHLFFFL
ncbi:MAG: prepilin peptidase [Pseudomonadota bacterium]